VVTTTNFNKAEHLQELLKKEYFPLRSYELYVSPEYYRLNGGDIGVPNLEATVTVHVKKSADSGVHALSQ
jgi:hypothetical protein